MINIDVPEELVKFIHKYSKFLLISHVDPDGDCIASSLALGSCLKRLGKQVEYYNRGPFFRKEIIEYAALFSDTIPRVDPSADRGSAAIIIDCAQPDRIGNFASRIEALPKAVIDHHIASGNYGDVRFINSSAPAVSLLVQQLIGALGLDLSYEEAELIFFAFATDTGFFSFLEGNQEETFKMIAELTRIGVSPRAIKNKLSYQVSLQSRQYFGKLLERATSYVDGACVCTWSSYEEIQEYSDKDRDSASVYQQLLKIAGVKVVLVLWEKQPNIVSGNIRTGEEIDASRIAKKFGGGGHARAAGFEAKSSISGLIDDFTQEISKILKLIPKL